MNAKSLWPHTKWGIPTSQYTGLPHPCSGIGKAKLEVKGGRRIDSSGTSKVRSGNLERFLAETGFQLERRTIGSHH